ncbi:MULTISPECIES: prepilin-type N-terminal cleavage/methylation domain-containing protein [Coprobacillaceae]|uniref:prepilin-type N-terminal cleavage/methylation domain-containing protein n=1 Tax=Coprobacillaceae TaxID=2810280 RepID=UPI000E496492|nr:MULTISPECIES: prepilin-type N-terminal cleavage/methylation domain-containing protein [Coprobacillaceae]RHM63631.1 hypothetical protein DWZ53_00635 [Coprobacillus sp. AF33-1AC]RHS96360.1 hypothetical protein DW911_00635 [Erysipelatoclostridium sp. AM42-17]
MDSRRLPCSDEYGFTLIEVLLSLVITLMIVINSATIIGFVYKSQNPEIIDSKLQNAMKILSQNIVTGYDYQYGRELNFKNEKDEEVSIFLDSKNRLIMTPGHYIYCHDIESVNFYKKDHLIYIVLTTKKHQSTFLIGSDYDEPEGDGTANNTYHAFYYYL